MLKNDYKENIAIFITCVPDDARYTTVKSF